MTNAEYEAVIQSLKETLGTTQKLVEDLKFTLAQKDELIASMQKTLETTNASMASLQQECANLHETLEEFKRKLFGTSSEKTSRLKKETAESSSAEPGSEDTTMVKEHPRTRKKKSVREDL